MNGKGSGRRPCQVPPDTFSANWDRVFKRLIDEEIKECVDAYENNTSASLSIDGLSKPIADAYTDIDNDNTHGEDDEASRPTQGSGETSEG